MTASSSLPTSQNGQRLLSLDFLRGVIMVILILGETGVFLKLNEASPNRITHLLAIQFEHSIWHGLHFWDLLLPAFMFVAGTAMAFSYQKQKQLHYSWKQSFLKTLRRSFWLLFFGVLIYAVRDNHLNLQFSNVLTELAFATLISFLIINWPPVWQLTVSILLLLITEFLFRFTHIPGFDQPFTDQHNFGNYIDLIVIGRVNGHYGTTMNWIPCAASTIWGLMAGQLLLSNKSVKRKLSYLAAFGLLTLVLGFTLDRTGITPMLKWISSSSFVLATGGISIIALAICYWWIDVRRHQRYLRFFTVVGMNSIFIYLFYNFIGAQWLYGYADILISGLLNLINIPFTAGAVISCLAVFVFEWYLCYFLFKKRIFFKL
jgi:predicted acyltransferase